METIPRLSWSKENTATFCRAVRTESVFCRTELKNVLRIHYSQERAIEVIYGKRDQRPVSKGDREQPRGYAATGLSAEDQVRCLIGKFVRLFLRLARDREVVVRMGGNGHELVQACVSRTMQVSFARFRHGNRSIDLGENLGRMVSIRVVTSDLAFETSFVCSSFSLFSR